MATRTRAYRRAVFLDRDGVVNRSDVKKGKPYAPRRLSDFRLLPGVARAVADLKAAGFIIVVVTNQPDVGHGLISRETLDSMHEKLRAKVPVDGIMVCRHRQDEGCSCRKPKPGLIRQAMRRWGINATGSYMVGDRWNDVVAGHAAGLYTIFVDRGYAEGPKIQPDLTVRSLRQAASIILTRGRHGEKR
jgi:D-glycero-D-manno-heptose 1,7-bisphosphate phosphatase